VLGGGVIAATVASIVILMIQGPELTTTLILWTVVVQNVGSIAVLLYLSRTRGTGSLATDFGLAIRLEYWWGLPAGAALQFAAAIVTAPLITLLFPNGAPEQEMITITETSRGAVQVVLLLLALVVLAPISEEMTFRGLLLSRTLRSMALWLAIITQAAVFALIHLADPSAIAAVPGLFLIALVLGYAAIRTGDISLSLTLHAGVNLTAAVLLLYGGDLLTKLEEMTGGATESMISFLRLVF
jgi:membrane protease YdiL (CAAX protease family)